MKTKSWINYFIYIFLIVAFLYFGKYIFSVVDYYRSNFINWGPYSYYLILFAFFGLIGVLLGMDHFFKEKGKYGMWKVNLPKLVMMGVPSLYFSLYILYYSPIKILLYPVKPFIQKDMTFILIFHLILGYVIITSFYKTDEA